MNVSQKRAHMRQKGQMQSAEPHTQMKMRSQAKIRKEHRETKEAADGGGKATLNLPTRGPHCHVSILEETVRRGHSVEVLFISLVLAAVRAAWTLWGPQRLSAHG